MFVFCNTGVISTEWVLLLLQLMRGSRQKGREDEKGFCYSQLAKGFSTIGKELMLIPGVPKSFRQ